MPPKKKAKASSQPSFDKTLFVSAAAEKRYNEYKNRPLIPERGLDIAGPINIEITRRHWEKLTEPSEPAVVSLVQEFYANAVEGCLEGEESDDIVFVRGKRVSIHCAEINRFYDLPNEGAFAVENSVNWSEVLDRLCASPTEWSHCVQDGSVSSFPTKCMDSYPKAWFYFIAAKMLPVSHLSSVHSTRAAVIFAILNGTPLNVGSYIQAAIRYSIMDETLGLVCPSLITSLCLAAGVKLGPNEAILPEKGMLTEKSLRAMKASQSDLRNNDASVFPKTGSLSTRMNHLGTLLNNHCLDYEKFKSQFSHDMQGLDHRLEAFFAYQRKSNEVLHQAFSQLAAHIGLPSSSLPPLPIFPPREPDPVSDPDAGPSRSS